VKRHLCVLAGVAACAALVLPDPAGAGRRRAEHEAVGFQTFTSPQASPVVLSPDGAFVYVANTTSNTVDVISTSTNTKTAAIGVGVEPVGLAVRPDGLEVWVSNHVSDSVSVIDTDPGSASYRQVVETVQSLDANGVTKFDEPVGVAFREDGARAYVALSSSNQVAVVDAGTYQVTGFLNVRAQEPRALAVRGGLLYVAAFETGNQTEISACGNVNGNNIPGHQCSLGLADLASFVTDPNLPGRTKNIVVDATSGATVPDRDLFVFDTATNAEVAAVTGVGTLLYGVAVNSAGRAFVSVTDARNQVNGNEGENLIDLDNRMFLNQISGVTCTTGGCGAVTRFDLEPLPPSNPAPGSELATPYGIAVSADDSTLVVSAAGTSRLFTANAVTGAVRDVLDVGSIPKGVALRSAAGTGAPQTAYVLNTLGNTVSVVNVTNPDAITLTKTINVGNDPTPAAVRLGRIAFANAFASSSGTFSCESCHPDSNVDQLLWRIGGACFFSDESGTCTGDDEPRTTMPVRGLKHTIPLHWDGTLGDPFGGPNGAISNAGSEPPSCTLGDADGDHDCFVDLVLGSLSGVMCDQAGSCPPGGNELSAQEIDDMASFLAAVSYPPARSRRIDDTLSKLTDPTPVQMGAITVSAHEGFKDFFMNQQGGSPGNPDTCADSNAGCHELPLGVSTNSETLAGFDAPTMRGMTDRFLQFSLGVTNPVELLAIANTGIDLRPLINFFAGPLEAPIQWDPNQGYREVTTFGTAFIAFEGVYGTRPLNTFQMFEEASTGYSGATARQLTLNTATAGLSATNDLMTKLEAADARGVVNLRAAGLRNGSSVLLSYRGDTGGTTYKGSSAELTHAQMLAEAQAGTLLVTLTAHLRGAAADPQPLLAQNGVGNGTTGDPPLPNLSSGGSSDPPAFTVIGTDVMSAARVFVDGVPATGATLGCSAGVSGAFCNDGAVSIDLLVKPASGTHLLQVQNPSGRLSNEMPFCVGSAGGCV
jgi:YVTN family beta-propeller protein